MSEVHRYGDHAAQFGELSLPSGRLHPPTVVLVHGGFWRARYDLSLGRPLAGDLVARGYAVWNLEYRRVGAGGGWPTTFADVATGIDALAHLPVDTTRVVAVGHSAGGHLAAWAAGRPRLPVDATGGDPRVRLTGVVSQAGVLALTDAARERIGAGAALDLMGGDPDEHADPYRLADPVAVAPLDVPVLCLHSRRDENVPYSQSETYVAASGGRARLHETDGDHFTLIDPASRDWRLVVDELESFDPS